MSSVGSNLPFLRLHMKHMLNITRGLEVYPTSMQPKETMMQSLEYLTTHLDELIKAEHDAAAPTPSAAVPEDRISPWQPESDPVRLAALGKTIEELGELSQTLARCVIQGVDASDPKTGVRNRENMWNEIADVVACIEMLTIVFNLNVPDTTPRVDKKVAGYRKWIQMIRGGKSDARAA